MTTRHSTQRTTPRRLFSLRLGLGLGALLTASALSAGLTRILINGRVVPGSVVTVGGQTYVPLSALTAAGFKVSTAGDTLSITTSGAAQPSSGAVAGGSQQINALSGCLNQTLFNGVWRVKFSNLRVIQDEGTARWAVDLEARNGTAKAMNGADGLLFADDQHMSFITADGTPMSWSITDSLNGQKVTYSQFQPSGVWRGMLTTFDGNAASPNRRPTKLVWRIDVSEGGSFAKALPWGVKDPSFRIDLTCTK